MDDKDTRPQLYRVLIITALVMGGYTAYTFFSRPDAPAPEAGGRTEGQAAGQTTGDGAAGPGVAAEEGRGAEGATVGPAHGQRPAQPGQRVQPPARMDPAERERLERTGTIETDDFRVTLTNLAGAAKSILLLRERYRDPDGQPMELVTTTREKWLPLGLVLGGVAVPEDAVWELEQLSPREVRLRWQGDGFTVERTVTAGAGPYQLWSEVSVKNDGGAARPVRVGYGTAHYVLREDEEGGFFASRSPEISHGVCMWGEDEVTRLDREGGLGSQADRPAHGFGPAVRFAGTENAYFAHVLAADGEPAERCQITSTDRYAGGSAEPHGSLFETRLLYPRVELAGGETTTVRTLAYYGPKDTAALEAAGHGLKEVVDLGWFSLVAGYLVALLGLIHGFVGNWGLAIIVMTILVRIVLFPLTWKSFQSMARMRVLKPDMERINDLYKDDREKKGAAMMELYRKHKINPLGGCLPQLLQMPVWFAFYASLSTNVELYHANFALHWTDLSAPDPYYSLPLLLGALMFVQQKITPTTMDPAQAKIMLYFMPVMITSFMLFLPAGLCLYMVTNSVLGIGQQQWIHRSLDRKTAAEAAAAAATSASEQDEEDEDEEPEDAELIASSVVSRSKIRPKIKSRKTAKRRTRRARS